jgi:hypothetical protein
MERSKQELASGDRGDELSQLPELLRVEGGRRDSLPLPARLESGVAAEPDTSGLPHPPGRLRSQSLDGRAALTASSPRRSRCPDSSPGLQDGPDAGMEPSRLSPSGFIRTVAQSAIVGTKKWSGAGVMRRSTPRGESSRRRSACSACWGY